MRAALLGVVLVVSQVGAGRVARAQVLTPPVTDAVAPPLTSPALAWDAGTEARRQRLLRAHRGLEITTAAALVVAGAIGTVALVNQPTLFGPGRCQTGDPAFGSYGCDGLSLLHGMGGVATAVLYTATRVVEVTTPGYAGPPPGPRRTAYHALGYVHLVTMILQPVLGLVGAYPQVVGLEPDKRSDFSRTLRTLHVFSGYLTAATFLASTSINF